MTVIAFGIIFGGSYLARKNDSRNKVQKILTKSG